MVKPANNLKEAIDQIFPQFAQNRAQGLCATCGENVGEFKDELSKKEFRISGCCQKCQDIIFGGHDEED